MVHLRLALLREVGTKSWSLWPWFLWDPTSKETMVDQDYVVCEVCVCVFTVYMYTLYCICLVQVYMMCVFSVHLNVCILCLLLVYVYYMHLYAVCLNIMYVCIAYTCIFCGYMYVHVYIVHLCLYMCTCCPNMSPPTASDSQF